MELATGFGKFQWNALEILVWRRSRLTFSRGEGLDRLKQKYWQEIIECRKIIHKSQSISLINIPKKPEFTE